MGGRDSTILRYDHTNIYFSPYRANAHTSLSSKKNPQICMYSAEEKDTAQVILLSSVVTYRVAKDVDKPET